MGNGKLETGNAEAYVTRTMTRTFSIPMLIVSVGLGCSEDALSRAMTTAADPAMHARLARAGDGYGARVRHMTELVPSVKDLIAGGQGAADKMLARFAGTPDFSRDAELVIYAYALSQMKAKVVV